MGHITTGEVLEVDCFKAEAMLKALGSVLDDQDMEPLDIIICGAMVLLKNKSVLEVIGHGELAERI